MDAGAAHGTGTSPLCVHRVPRCPIGGQPGNGPLWPGLSGRARSRGGSRLHGLEDLGAHVCRGHGWGTFGCREGEPCSRTLQPQALCAPAGTLLAALTCKRERRQLDPHPSAAPGPCTLSAVAKTEACNKDAAVEARPEIDQLGVRRLASRFSCSSWGAHTPHSAPHTPGPPNPSWVFLLHLGL